MRRALIALLLFPLAVVAEDLPPLAPAAPVAPAVMMASAANGPEGVTLHIRKTHFVPTPVETTVRTPVTVTDVVNGRLVERKQIVAETHVTTVLKAVPGEVIPVIVNCSDVVVADLKGTPIDPKRLPLLLRAEKPVLVSLDGPVNPFFLQTAKPGTLVVMLPAAYLDGASVSPREALPPPLPGPGEPPLAPARP